MANFYPIMKIQRMQFDSLIRTPVSYLLLDLRPSGMAPLFSRSVYVTEATALTVAGERQKDKKTPIVVIAEQSAKAEQVGNLLAENGYINVVVLDEAL